MTGSSESHAVRLMLENLNFLKQLDSVSRRDSKSAVNTLLSSLAWCMDK